MTAVQLQRCLSWTAAQMCISGCKSVSFCCLLLHRESHTNQSTTQTYRSYFSSKSTSVINSVESGHDLLSLHDHRV